MGFNGTQAPQGIQGPIDPNEHKTHTGFKVKEDLTEPMELMEHKAHQELLNLFLAQMFI